MKKAFWVVAMTWMTAGIGCGGSQPAVEEPTSGSAPAREAEESEAPEEPVASSEESADSAASEEAETKSETSRRSPKDLITTPGALFTFSFRDSEAYQRAEKACGEKAGDDPAKKAACMSKARDQFEGDSLWFKKEEDGTWWWLTIQKRGSSLKALHKIEFEFGEETENSITIKTKGRDKGSKPMARVPREVVIEVPSESKIVLDDPKHGKMVYEVKYGLVGDSER